MTKTYSQLLHAANGCLHRSRGNFFATLFLVLGSAAGFAQEDYCNAATTYVDGQGITNVTIGSINNNTGIERDNYGDYTDQVVNIGRGATYNVSIRLETTIAYSVKVWIDWNNNFVFENSEQVFTSISGDVPSDVVSGNFTVPAGATLGNHRMRVGALVQWAGIVQPCPGEFDSAAYEDYTVNVTTPPTCLIPGTPIVDNAASGTVNVRWAAPLAGTPSGYEYAVTSSSTPPASGTAVTGTSVTDIEVPTNAPGYIFVRSNCGNGNYSEWSAGTYYNGYCIPQPPLLNGTGITNVTIGSINNETSAEENNYGDFTTQQVSVGQGATQQFSITLSTGSSYQTSIWIDWNNDLDFDDDGEQVYLSRSEGRAVETLRGSFSVPANAALGTHRMRVGGALVFIGQTFSPCGQDLGAYEDYTLNVVDAPTCFAPVSILATTVTAGIADISWDPSRLGTAPAGYEYAITTTPTPPASGTVENETIITGVAVTANTTNYIHVRTNCGNGDYSEWFTEPYYNGYCISTPRGVDGNGIINFTIGTINNTTEAEEGNYADYSAQVVNIGQGVNKQFSITFNTSGLPYNTGIWVDWNDDLDFNDENEQVFTGTSIADVTAVLRGYLSVPLTAPLGNHRLRIGANPTNYGNAVPCDFDEYGVYEDYTVNVTTPPGCYTPDGFEAATESAGLASLSWTAPQLGGTPAGYEYAVTTTPDAPESGTETTQTSVNNVAVTLNALNYLHVRTNCGNDGYSEWVTIELYNGYCVPAPEFTDGEGITNVTIGSINNTTGDEETHYGDYSAQVANIGQGVTQQFSISLVTPVIYNVKIWIDFNDNLVFEETEEVYSGAPLENNPTNILGLFTIPENAELGNHRLRIAAVSPWYDVTTCDSRYGASYEDYTVNITTPPTCYTPESPVATVTAPLTATLSWDAPRNGNAPTGYEYAVTTSTTPPASGTATSETTVTGYTFEENNTYYYLHVRTNCGDGDYSNWVISERFRYLPGDICSTAVDLATLTSPYSFSTLNAGNESTPGCGFGDAPDIFYKVEVPNGYTFNIELTSTNYDFISTLFYGGCEPNNSTIVFCTTTFDEARSTSWENTTGQTQTVYWVMDGYDTYAGNYTFEWSFTEPAACDRPRRLSSEVTSANTVTVSWEVPNLGTPEGYEYAVTTSREAPESGEYTTALSIPDVTITLNTTSYLHVRSVCGNDGNSVWVTYEFFVGYCIPENTNPDSYITGITTTGAETNFSNTGTGFSAYTDYTATHSVSTYAGGSFAITATHRGAENMYYAWVDWNNDYEFSDNERVLNTNFLASPANLGSVSVPAGTAEGSYRMRIRNAVNAAVIAPCGEANGEAEDYTLIVGPTPTCFPPFAPSIEPVDATSANLRWSPPILGDFPQGYEYVLSTSSTAPTGSGTPTTAIFVEAVPYNSEASVYLFVRSICGDGEFSTWETASILDTNVPQFDKNSVLVYKQGNAINVETGTALMTAVNVYDIRGAKLYTQSNINATNTAITGLQVQQQVLIIEVLTAKGKVSKRIVY
ncbi:T9SS sorting signal type C domain-containing protein [Flavobacterium sp. Sd200]|uniref:GEVED domain-containing protein n=1 Tax=Flavobacterium sp. Sd200 TaxID=2692211 RepID=UPI00136DE9CD|nr:GEVED domain-containing protein [Flavobacterium sp. Sd200]MXN92715.1 T9SS sorting signal type C domain-containing protein [Flavobacterium sp. Sd200]